MCCLHIKLFDSISMVLAPWGESSRLNSERTWKSKKKWWATTSCDKYKPIFKFINSYKASVSWDSATQEYYFGIKINSGHFFSMIKGLFIRGLSCTFLPRIIRISIWNYFSLHVKKWGNTSMMRENKFLFFIYEYTEELDYKRMSGTEKD